MAKKTAVKKVEKKEKVVAPKSVEERLSDVLVLIFALNQRIDRIVTAIGNSKSVKGV